MGVQNPDISSVIHRRHNYCSSPAVPDAKSSRTADFCSPLQCLEFDPEFGHSTSISRSDYEQQIESLHAGHSKAKRRSRRSGCTKRNSEKDRENVCAGRQVCNCAASFAADCAAICCCCPCAVLHLLVVVIVRVPAAVARKAFCYAKKKALKSDQKKKHDDDDEKRENRWYYTPPWSCGVSPQTSGPLDTSFSAKVDTDKVWSELYATGHMGFGASLFDQMPGGVGQTLLRNTQR